MSVKYEVKTPYEIMQVSVNCACYIGKDLLEVKGKPNKANVVLFNKKTQFLSDAKEYISDKRNEYVAAPTSDAGAHAKAYLIEKFTMMISNFSLFVFDKKEDEKYFTNEVIGEFSRTLNRTTIKD